MLIIGRPAALVKKQTVRYGVLTRPDGISPLHALVAGGLPCQFLHCGDI